MPTPLYQGIQVSFCPEASHKGLWYQRFFDCYDDDWSVPDVGKKGWIKTVCGECGDRIALIAACERQNTLVTGLGGQSRARTTDWRFVSGLGLPHPVENGFLWHPTLGVPYLPGAAVKGLVRAWIEQWREDEDERLETLHRWFGSDAKDPLQRELEAEAGGFTFFDAIPFLPPVLAADIMTPHMGDWYAEGDKINGDKVLDVTEAENYKKVPADWHDPVPVPFLVIKEATFLFSVAPRTTDCKRDLAKVMDALANALQWLGAGAKTAVGYGRMSQTLDEQKLAAMLGKEFKKTSDKYGNNFQKFVSQVMQIYGDVVNTWKGESKESNKGKAYKNVMRILGKP